MSGIPVADRWAPKHSGVRDQPAGERETNPVWSPDGRLIAFTSDRHSKPGKRERWGPDFELYVMRANGTGIRRLTHNSVPDLIPDWQAKPR